MAMLVYDDRLVIAPLRREPATPAPRDVAAVDDSKPDSTAADGAAPEPTEPDDDVQERWLQAQPWPRRWFARFYRALRKLQPAFPPMSCC
jgi:hypothetical protein